MLYLASDAEGKRVSPVAEHKGHATAGTSWSGGKKGEGCDERSTVVIHTLRQAVQYFPDTPLHFSATIVIVRSSPTLFCSISFASALSSQFSLSPPTRFRLPCSACRASEKGRSRGEGTAITGERVDARASQNANKLSTVCAGRPKTVSHAVVGNILF